MPRGARSGAVVYVLTHTHYSQPACSNPDQGGSHDFSNEFEGETDVQVLGVFTTRAAAEQYARRHTRHDLDWSRDCRMEENEAVIWSGWSGPPEDRTHWLYDIEPWHLDGQPMREDELPTPIIDTAQTQDLITA